MNYTLLTCQDLDTGQVLDLVKNGNTYYIEFVYKEIDIRVKFKTMKEAKEKYLEIVSYFISGYYSLEQRIELLNRKGE